jgi:hypothetical protein
MPPFCCGRRDSLAERIDLPERRGELNDAKVGLKRQNSGTQENGQQVLEK